MAIEQIASQQFLAAKIESTRLTAESVPDTVFRPVSNGLKYQQTEETLQAQYGSRDGDVDQQPRTEDSPGLVLSRTTEPATAVDHVITALPAPRQRLCAVT